MVMFFMAVLLMREVSALRATIDADGVHWTVALDSLIHMVTITKVHPVEEVLGAKWIIK